MSSCPFHSNGARNEVKALLRIGVSSTASFQLRPPSMETSTLLILPCPLQAMPRSSCRPLRVSFCVPDGDVMMDLASIMKENLRARPSGIRSVYFDVSSFEYAGWSVTCSRRSHLMLMFPSYPGTNNRSG
ncbi:hypothetical protein D3C72_1715780 [compost metagenome]